MQLLLKLKRASFVHRLGLGLLAVAVSAVSASARDRVKNEMNCMITGQLYGPVTEAWPADRVSVTVEKAPFGAAAEQSGVSRFRVEIKPLAADKDARDGSPTLSALKSLLPSGPIDLSFSAGRPQSGHFKAKSLRTGAQQADFIGKAGQAFVDLVFPEPERGDLALGLSGETLSIFAKNDMQDLRRLLKSKKVVGSQTVLLSSRGGSVLDLAFGLQVRAGKADLKYSVLLSGDLDGGQVETLDFNTALPMSFREQNQLGSGDWIASSDTQWIQFAMYCRKHQATPASASQPD